MSEISKSAEAEGTNPIASAVAEPTNTTTTTPTPTPASNKASASASASTQTQPAKEQQQAERQDEEAPAERNAIGAWALIPHFPSRDINRTVTYYTTVLHFSLGEVKTNESGTAFFASLYIGHPAYCANIYFMLRGGDEIKGKATGEGSFHPVTAMVGLATTQVDEYYHRLRREGHAMIVEDIADMHYGFRQFAVRDHDGNQLQFFCFLEGGNPSD